MKANNNKPRDPATARSRNLNFDPDAAATAGSGIFGLPFTPDDARVVIVPVPFEATTSYGGGTSDGPQAVFEASKQVDLFDRETGRPYEAGIAMLEVPKKIARWNERAKKSRSKKRVDKYGDAVNDWVYEKTKALLAEGKMPVTLGGDHSVPFGAIRAYAEKYPGLGILHLDAHADLRDAYDGYTWSHASIFHNVMTKIDGVGKLVQVGVRDVGAAESRMIEQSNGRIVTFFDPDLAAEKEEGKGWAVAMSTAGFERGVSLRSPARFLSTARRLVELYRAMPVPDERDAVTRAWMDAEAYSLHTQWTVSRLLDGGTIGAEASLNKIFWSEMDLRMHETALRLLRERHDEGWLDGFLFSLSGPIYAGTNEIQRNVIAERVLGLPRS